MLKKTLSAGLMLLSLSLSAEEFNSLPAVQVPVSDAITVDGDLKEQDGKKALEFKPLSGEEKAIAEKTEAWVNSTKEGLALSIRCFDSSMDKLVSTERKRDDDVWKDDSVEIFLQIGSDKTRKNGAYYHIAINPNGSILDTFNGKKDWNGENIKVAVKKNEKSWDLEVSIPFADLDGDKIKEVGDKPWRLNIIRCRPSHKGDEEVQEVAWSPTKSNDNHVPERFGYLFLENFGAKIPAKEEKK